MGIKLFFMKKCFICNEEKELDEFYKHSKMADGHLNKCKTCTKRSVRKRELDLNKNPNWQEKEKARHRDKYYRLNYKEKHKPSSEKKKEIMNRYKERYPEKKLAKMAIGKLKTKGIERHHWSYNEEHWKDVIELSIADHNLLHRYMKYDQSIMMYCTLEGRILDSKISHIDLLHLIKQIEQN